MPAERMSLHLYLLPGQERSGVHGALKSRFSLRRLISAPVEREGPVIIQIQPLFHPVFAERIVLSVICIRNRVKCAAAKQEAVPCLLDFQHCISDRISGRICYLQSPGCLSVRIVPHPL